MTDFPAELAQTLKAGRSAHLDWLSDNAPIDHIASTLTAMANSHGGMLVIGVLGPAGTVVGVKDVENTIDRVLQAALQIGVSGALMAFTTETLVHRPRHNRDEAVDFNP